MSPSRAPRRNRSSEGGGLSAEDWKVFVGFWLAAALTFAIVGIAELAVIPHGRRVGFVFCLLAAACLLAAVVSRRAARQVRD